MTLTENLAKVVPVLFPGDVVEAATGAPGRLCAEARNGRVVVSLVTTREVLAYQPPAKFRSAGDVTGGLCSEIQKALKELRP